MKLWVGLGNPGAKYAQNRHNIGFMAMDRIAVDHGFGPWKSRFQASTAEGRLGEERVVLVKPQTFMNLSGQAVRAALDYHRLTPADVTVFHDELDLAPGRMRLKQGGGHAGHNGLRSIHAHLGEGYGRVRLGIGHPGHKDAVSGYVLHDFARSDADWLDDLMRGLSEGAVALARGDTAGFQNAVALRTAPPRSGGGAVAEGKRGRPPADPGPTPTTGPDPGRGAPATPGPTPARGAAETPDAPADPRSAMQRLLDRFR